MPATIHDIKLRSPSGCDAIADLVGQPSRTHRASSQPAGAAKPRSIAPTTLPTRPRNGGPIHEWQVLVRDGDTVTKYHAWTATSAEAAAEVRERIGHEPQRVQITHVCEYTGPVAAEAVPQIDLSGLGLVRDGNRRGAAWLGAPTQVDTELSDLDDKASAAEPRHSPRGRQLALAAVVAALAVGGLLYSIAAPAVLDLLDVAAALPAVTRGS